MGQSRMREYLELMAKDGRLIIINKDDKTHTLVTFSICEDYERYVDKGIWEYKDHNPKGSICYIEKIITDGWSREIRKQLESEITTRYPAIAWAVWYRPTQSEDRKVIRRIRETSLRN